MDSNLLENLIALRDNAVQELTEAHDWANQLRAIINEPFGTDRSVEADYLITKILGSFTGSISMLNSSKVTDPVPAKPAGVPMNSASREFRVSEERMKSSSALNNGRVMVFKKRSLLNQAEPSHARNWQLHFDDRLPSTLFTGSKIESEHGKPVKIVLLDAISKNIITSLTLSSIKVQIVVLDGDFGVDDEEDWTEEEFNTNVVLQREGKRPLVTGELVVTLRGGVGYIGDVSFTNNSSWIRSGRFKLGARTVSSELRIREAKSEAFAVKDRRGVLYQKNHPPVFSDEIRRLEKIAKDGQFHKLFATMGITTVKEFQCFYCRDPSSLHNILGGISNKSWEKIIEHATACVLYDELYYMYPRDEERVAIVLNSVFRVVAAVIDGQIYEPLDKLNLLQLGLVENLKRRAYKNLDDLVPLDEPPVFGPGTASLQPIILPGVHQGHRRDQGTPNMDSNLQAMVFKRRKTASTCILNVPNNGYSNEPDDGYSWRKYGQEEILGAKHPREYYRCTFRNVQGCLANKQMQRTDDDPSMYETTYRGEHTCKNQLTAPPQIILDSTTPTESINSPHFSFGSINSPDDELDYQSYSTSTTIHHPPVIISSYRT